jgi:hypothetical protein
MKLFTITRISLLMPLMESVAVYSDNDTKHINTLRGQNAVTGR